VSAQKFYKCGDEAGNMAKKRAMTLIAKNKPGSEAWDLAMRQENFGRSERSGGADHQHPIMTVLFVVTFSNKILDINNH
jgi:hypothetical protein